MLDAESDNLVQMYNVKNIEIRTSRLENVQSTESELQSSQDVNDNVTTEIKYVVIDGDKYIAKNYIDCTQDSEITAMAGSEYTIGWEDINEKNKSMSASVLEATGVREEGLWLTVGVGRCLGSPVQEPSRGLPAALPLC